MKKHSGMRPHDIAILLKIVAKGRQKWYMKDLAYELGVSASEVSESINRSVISGLIAGNKKRIMTYNLLDFLEHGLQYVYPQQPGAIKRGIATAHSAEPLKNIMMSKNNYIWSYAKGNMRGQEIEPLHPNIPEACLKDSKFYELMALCDSLRVGKSREKKIAIEEIKKRLC